MLFAMAAIDAILRKELLQHLQSFRYLLVSTVVVLLSLLAALAGATDFEQRRAAHQARLEGHREALRQVHVYSQVKPLALRPPEPLALFSRGVESRLGEAVTIHLFAIPHAASGAHRGNPFLAPFQEIDLTTIVRVVLSLAALIITFDSLRGERESRNLELMLVSGARHAEIWLGKLVAAVLALLLPLAASVALTWGVLSLRVDVSLGGVAAWRALGLCAAYSAYLTLMALLGLLLSLITRTSARALVAGVLLWLLLVLLIPRLPAAIGGEAAGERRVEREVERLESERDRLLDQREAEFFGRFARTGHFAPVRVAVGEDRAVLHRYGSAVYYDALVSHYRDEAKLGRRYAERIFALRQEQRDATAVARRTGRLFALLSPAFLLERVSASLAGTSDADQDDFLASCRAFRQHFFADLERRGTLDSWRWFTDDPPPGRPWTTYLGIAPEEVGEESFRSLVARYRAELQDVFQREQEDFRQDPRRLLALDDLPRYRFSPVGPGRALARVAGEAGLLLALDVALLLVIASFARRQLAPRDDPARLPRRGW